MKIFSNFTIIRIKDIVRITGLPVRSAERLHSKIKKAFNKTRAGFITIDEFCAYTGFTESRVLLILGGLSGNRAA